jgi:hypothetical protein
MGTGGRKLKGNDSGEKEEIGVDLHKTKTMLPEGM